MFADALSATILRPYYPVSDLFGVVSDDLGLQVDFMATIHGVRTFESLRSRAVAMKLADTSLCVAALRDIVRSKRAAGRPNVTTLCSRSWRPRSMKAKKCRRPPTRAQRLAALALESDHALREQISRLLGLADGEADALSPRAHRSRQRSLACGPALPSKGPWPKHSPHAQAEWTTPRRGQPNVTQMHYARQGQITGEMAHVAARENVDPELIRSEVARRAPRHPGEHQSRAPLSHDGYRHLAPLQGEREHRQHSAVTSSLEGELRKLEVSLKHGADTVMDLSTGGDIDGIRQAIIGASPVPIGTVPVYQAIKELKDVAKITASDLLDMLEHQAKQGVDYFTIHAGVLVEYLPLVKDRITGIVSRGGSLMAQWMLEHHQQNPFFHPLGQGARDLQALRRHHQRRRRASSRLLAMMQATRRSSPS